MRSVGWTCAQQCTRFGLRSVVRVSAARRAGSVSSISAPTERDQEGQEGQRLPPAVTRRGWRVRCGQRAHMPQRHDAECHQHHQGPTVQDTAAKGTAMPQTRVRADSAPRRGEQRTCRGSRVLAIRAAVGPAAREAVREAASHQQQHARSPIHADHTAPWCAAGRSSNMTDRRVDERTVCCVRSYVANRGTPPHNGPERVKGVPSPTAPYSEWEFLAPMHGIPADPAVGRLALRSQ